MAATAPETKGDLTWEVNNTSKEVFTQQTAVNSYPGIALDSYDVKWFDDYTDALYAIPENSSKYATKQDMLGDTVNSFKLFLSSDGDIKGSTGWSLHPGPSSELGDEVIENNGGYPGYDFDSWTFGLDSRPTITHSQGLVDVNNDNIIDYILKIDNTTPIQYGIGHTTDNFPIPQTGGSLSFEAIPEPAVGPVLAISNATISFESISNVSYTIFSSTNLTNDSWLVETNITADSTNTVFLIDTTNTATFYKATTD